MWNNNIYTVELGELVESGVDIWAFDYPSFYEGEAKKAFEKKVIDHYYFRQIGQETVGRFLHMFRSRMNDIMPFYIKRYESVKLMDEVGDPFEAYNLTETFAETRTGKGKLTGSTTDQSTSSSDNSTEGSSDKNATVRNLDTPQGNIGNLDDGYLTNATKTDESSTDSQSSESNATMNASGSTSQDTENEDTVNYTLTRRGNIGVQPLGAEINAYRSALINVDLEVIEALNDLFLLVY